VQEEVGPAAAHRLVHPHPAEVGVDAPALAGGVAAPDEAHVALRAAHRRALEVPDLRLAELARPPGFREGDAVVVLLARRQEVELDLRGEVCGLRCQRPANEPRVAKRLGRGDLDVHLRGAVGTRPDDRAARRHVAALHAARELWATLWVARGSRGGRGQTAHRHRSGGRVEDEATAPDAPLEFALSAHLLPPLSSEGRLIAAEHGPRVVER